MKKAVAIAMSAVLLIFTVSCSERLPFDYDLSKYVTLGEYKNISYVPSRTEPTDDEIWERIIEKLDYYGMYAEQVFPEYVLRDISEGEVRYGDIVKMDISLTVDGEILDSGTTEGFTTEIGGNFFTSNITEDDAEEAGISYAFLTQFMTEIENKAVGTDVGEEYEISGTFPEDNFDNTLIGKEYTIKAAVTHIDIRYDHPDAVSDELLEDLGDYDDFDEYRETIVEDLEDMGIEAVDGEIWHRICYEFKRCGFYDYTLYEYYSEDISAGVVKYGDIVNIDFEGFVDGELYDNACAEDYSVEIGSGSLIEGFEDGLIGAVIGNEVTLNLTFPEDYGVKELNGKPVVFNVTVNMVKYRYDHPDVIPQNIMDQIFEYGGSETADFAQFFADVKEEIEAELVAAAETDKQNDVWAGVLKNCTLISCPDEEIEAYMEDYEEYYVSLAGYYGYDNLEDFLSYYGLTYDEFVAQGEEMAQEDIFGMMVMYQIARAEGLDKLDESEYEAGAQKYVEYYGMSDYAELCEQVGAYQVKEWVMSDMVLEFVCSNAVAAD